MRLLTLRARLTAASALVVVLAVAGVSIAGGFVIDHQMRAALDRALRERATAVARLAVSAPALLTAPGALEAPAAGRQLSVEVLDRRGRLLARSLALGARLLPPSPVVAAARRGGRIGLADAQLGPEALRMLAAPVADAGGPAAGGVVLVAASTRDIQDATARLRRLFLLFGVAAAALGGLAAAALTRGGLRPLRRLSAAAAEVERTGDPARRLPAPAARDEVGELAETLNRMLAALEEARLRERRFLADASHELRTPLTSLAGNVDFVVRHGANPEVVADLRHDTERLRRLVDDLLALEREGGAHVPQRPLRIDELVRDAVADRPRVRVLANPPAAARGDADALRRALDNLLENAEVHGPPGGEVLVELSVAGDRLRIAVTDAGDGLAPADAERAFERFWRGPAARGRPGAGLGLAIVAATARRHGGRAWADGPRVTIELPAAPLAAAAAQSPSQNWAARPGGSAVDARGRTRAEQ